MTMANLLESLATHYEQMDTALKDTETGEIFSEGDLQRASAHFSLPNISQFSRRSNQKCTGM